MFGPIAKIAAYKSDDQDLYNITGNFDYQPHPEELCTLITDKKNVLDHYSTILYIVYGINVRI